MAIQYFAANQSTPNQRSVIYMDQAFVTIFTAKGRQLVKHLKAKVFISEQTARRNEIKNHLLTDY